MSDEDTIRFGQLAIAQGWVSADVVRRAVAWQKQHAPHVPIGELLQRHSYLNKQQVAWLLQLQAEERKARAARPSGRPGSPSSPAAAFAPTPSSPTHGVAGWSPGGALAQEPPGGGTAVATGPTPRPEDEDPLLGQTLNRCLVSARLGAGAMSQVYLAHHEILRKDVVIKVLLQEHMAKQRTVERFRREAGSMARLEHPNVVMVFDVGTVPDGRPFMIMQYVDGQDLDKRIEAAGRLTPDEATRIVLDVARGLEAAHKAGVIHRDVKPENILIASSGTARVSDFGLAKDLALDPLTLDGHFVGTPLYMAPEGSGKAADHRVDIYALGVTLYYALTGVQPFREFKAHEVFHGHAHGKLKSPETHNPDISDPHRRVLGRMMAKDREQRYPDMAALIKDLENLVAGRPVEAPETILWGPRGGVGAAVAEAPVASKLPGPIAVPQARAPRWVPFVILGGMLLVGALAVVFLAVLFG